MASPSPKLDRERMAAETSSSRVRMASRYVVPSAGEKGNVEHVALVDDESIGRGKGKRGAGGAPVTPETMKPTRAVRRRASP